MIQNISISGINNNYAFQSKAVSRSNSFAPQSDVCQRQKVNFKGWFPHERNADAIAEGVKLIHEAKTIAISGHRELDGDASGGPLGLFDMLGIVCPDKHIVLISGEKFKDGFKIIDPDSKTKEILSLEDAVQYMNPDLFISVDVADKKLFHPNVLPIFESATKRLKIDHHPKNDKISPEEFYFGDVNIVDDKLESASQLVMQMAGPLGVVKKQGDLVPPNIANSLGLGLLTDSGIFAHAKGADIFLDAHAWIQSSGIKPYKQIRENLFKRTRLDYETETAVRSKARYTDDGKIAHMLLGKEFDTEPGLRFAKNVLQNLLGFDEVQHAFFVMERDDGTLKASIRSKTDKVKGVAEKLGGGGHPCVAAIDNVKDKSAQQLFDEILQGLTELDS